MSLAILKGEHVVRFYATCIDQTGEEIYLIAKGKSKEEAEASLIERYKLKQVTCLNKEPERKHRPKSYWPAVSSVMKIANAQPARSAGRSAAEC